MTAPMNRRYQRRFDNPAARPSSNERNMARFDKPTRDRITDLLVTLDGWDLVEEAQRATLAEAERRARWIAQQSTTVELRGRRRDPGE